MTIFERQGRDENLERYFEMAVGRAWLGWLPPAGNRISLLQIPQTHKKEPYFQICFLLASDQVSMKKIHVAGEEVEGEGVGG